MVRESVKTFGFLALFLSFICIFLYFFSFYVQEKKISTSIQEMIKNPNGYRMISSAYAILEVPSLSIHNYLYPIGSLENHVDKNVSIVTGSTMPDEKYSNLILASHSGFGKTAFFRNLDRLRKGDVARIYYKGNVYEYALVKMYQVEKTGIVVIDREKEKSHLTLITCDKKNKNLQDVYILEMK